MPVYPGALNIQDRGGHGIVGMRERVAMVGGEIQVGSGVDGGFAVRVTLPLDGD
ncbi:MAG TPA: hypothetical protein VFC19_43870 [Candidatus Limnocylindrales bacterium]|nr:hypothetical protein [Candidatus Limnocylindrales bacterium]